MPEIADLLKNTQLPVMPEVGMELIATLDDEDTPVSKIQALIARDPALTVKLLALANSAAFGLKRQVASLDAALSLVGLARVRALALSACLQNAFSLPHGIDRTAFWKYCMRCGAYAQWLAGGVGGAASLDKQKAWLAGVMLRLGETSLGHAFPEAVAKFEAQGEEPGSRWLAEKAVAGFDEGEVMAELARQWNFPADIVVGLRLAGNPLPTKPIVPLAGVLHLAARLADIPDADAKAIDTLSVPVMSALELKYGWLQSSFPAADSIVSLG